MKILNFTLKLLIFNFALLTILANPVHAGELANQFTLSLYVNPQTSIASKALIVKDSEIRLVTDSSGNPVCQIHNGTAWQTAVTSSTALITGSWAHVSCAYNKSNIYIYINGVQTGSGAQTATVNDSANALLIGQDDSGTYANFIGATDQVQVYNYARSVKQVVEDMNAGHPAVGSPVGSAVAHWSFDEGVNNTCSGGTNDVCNSGFAGSALDGAQSGMAVPATSTSGWTQSGKYGKALNFDGSDDIINATTNSMLNPASAMTISAWIRPIAGGGITRYMIVERTDGATDPYQLRFNPNTNALEAYVWNSSGSIYSKISSNNSVAFNQWSHVSMVFDSTSNTLNVYINGVVQGTATTTSGTLRQSTITTHIGNYFTGTNYAFKGTLDEVKIYNYALTSDEVKTEYNRGSSMVLGSLSDNSSYQPNAANQEYCIPGDTSSCAAPVGRWDFEEGSGSTVNDTSGNANTGTWNGTGSHWTTGKMGKSGKFNGSDDYVNVGTLGSLGSSMSSPITISFWIKWNGGADTAIKQFLGILNDGITTGITIDFNRNSALANEANATNFYLRDDSGDELSGHIESSKVYDGKWHYLTFVSNPSAATHAIYLDGISQTVNYDAVAKKDVINNPVNFAYSFYVGALNNRGTATNYTPVNLDQTRIFNYARSAAQIAWDYNRGAPVGHWKFDECQGTTANDSSGNSNTGTITIGTSGTQTAVGACTSSGAWYNGVSGKRNYSLNFDGTDDYVTGTDLDVSNAITLSAWVKTSSNSTQIIIRKTNTYELAVMNSSACPGVVDGSVTMIIGTGSIWGCPTSIYSASGTSSVGDSSWHHLVGTFDDPSNTIRIYIDGKLQTTYTSATVSFGTNNNTLYIGSNRDGGSTLDFSGQIDDVRVYNYALTATQIKNLYNGGAVNFAPNTGAP